MFAFQRQSRLRSAVVAVCVFGATAVPTQADEPPPINGAGEPAMIAVAQDRAEESATRADDALLALSPRARQRMRKKYDVLRRQAFENCRLPARTRPRGDNMIWCIESELQRLVDGVGNFALAAHHGYISQIPDDQPCRSVPRRPGNEDAVC